MTSRLAPSPDMDLGIELYIPGHDRPNFDQELDTSLKGWQKTCPSLSCPSTGRGALSCRSGLPCGLPRGRVRVGALALDFVHLVDIEGITV